MSCTMVGKEAASRVRQREPTPFPPKPFLPYERGWPSYKNADVRKSNRGVRICVRKLAANSSACAVSECAALPLQRVTKVIKLASTENIFY
jgi:hypothetical protein